MKNFITSLTIAILFSISSAFAQGGTTGPLTWILKDSTLTISGEGEMPDFFVFDPYMYSTPWYNYSYKTVVIENGVTSIGNYAFPSSRDLVSITIPNSVKQIGISAFDESGITSITIPNSVSSIKQAAFARCNKLTSINIPHRVTRIEDDTFSCCFELNSIIIPNSVTSIGNSAFSSCESLTSIIIPNSVTHFGNYAFKGCKGLTSITNLNPVPVAISSTVFQFVNQSACTLEVPMESVSAYQKVDVWKDFNIVGINVGVADMNNYSSLRVFPNPTTGELTIDNGQLTINNVEVFDIYGRKQKAESRKQKAEGGVVIDLSPLAAGIYFVKIYTEKGIFVEKLLKIR